MTKSISDLLANKWDQPAEIGIIQSFVRDKFGAVAGVTVQTNQIIITVPSAALAGSIRPHLHELQKQVGKKRLVLRIGSAN